MNNDNRNHFTASIQGVEISTTQRYVAVQVNGIAELDDDDVRAVINALDTANDIVSLWG